MVCECGLTGGRRFQVEGGRGRRCVLSPSFETLTGRVVSRGGRVGQKSLPPAGAGAARVRGRTLDGAGGHRVDHQLVRAILASRLACCRGQWPFPWALIRQAVRSASPCIRCAAAAVCHTASCARPRPTLGRLGRVEARRQHRADLDAARPLAVVVIVGLQPSVDRPPRRVLAELGREQQLRPSRDLPGAERVPDVVARRSSVTAGKTVRRWRSRNVTTFPTGNCCPGKRVSIGCSGRLGTARLAAGCLLRPQRAVSAQRLRWAGTQR